MYGRRGRIGLMVPTGNSVMEPEFNRLAPDGVSVHANRVYLKNVTPEALAGMEAHAAASAGPDHGAGDRHSGDHHDHRGPARA